MGTNVIAIQATLVADPTVRATTTGKTVTNARVAVDDGYGDSKKSYFFDVVAWQALGEELGRLTKGQKLGIYGKLTSRQYEKDGQKRNVIEILAQALDVRKDKSEYAAKTTPTQEIDDPNSIPF